MPVPGCENKAEEEGLVCRPLVTVGIINYNCIKYLKNCVDSYLGQSYGNIEIILVDDCSTDGSVEVLKELEQNNENLRCICHDINSGGPSAAIQELIEQAQGKYFQWIASDDYPDSNAIESFVDNLEKTNNDYVYCNFKIIDESNKVTDYWRYTLPTLEEMVVRIFSNASGIMPMNGLYRMDFFKSKGITWSVYRNNDHSSDTINSLYFAKNGMKYGFINEPLINYRLHQSNCSHNIEARLRTSLMVYDYIIKNFSEETYFPAIDWKSVSYREQLKSYTLASYFYTRITGYMGLKGIPQHLKYSVTQEGLKECVRCFVEEGKLYIRQGLEQKGPYSKELLALEDKYNKLLI